MRNKSYRQLQSSSTSLYESQPTSVLLGQGKTKINKVKCFECGQAGHFHRDSPKRKGTDGSMKTVHKTKTAAEDNSSDSDVDNTEVFTASVSSVKCRYTANGQVDGRPWCIESHAKREGIAVRIPRICDNRKVWLICRCN